MRWKVNIEPQANDDLVWYWEKDRAKYEKCKKLLIEISENPRKGTGKPERLKHFGNEEIWSRRVSRQDRLIYRIHDESKEVDAISCRGHYQ